jgi:hypothetical protein
MINGDPIRLSIPTGVRDQLEVKEFPWIIRIHAPITVARRASR